jgi:Leucine-rich repeat (LRR) protein
VVVDDNNALLELNLEDNNLEGTLPSCLTLCSKLKRLNLRGNKLSGLIVPPFICPFWDLILFITL